MRVYYLTGAPFAVSNLAIQRIKIARFSDLNDPFELLAVDLGNKRHRKAFRESRGEINAATGLICFSKSWRNPLLWGHYAEKHTGIALGFEVPALHRRHRNLEAVNFRQQGDDTAVRLDDDLPRLQHHDVV